MTISRERGAMTTAEAEAVRRAFARDRIVAAVQRDLTVRSNIGLTKYGTTLARTDLSHADWLRHAYEEALDLACYLKRVLTGLQAGQAPEGMPVSHDATKPASGHPGANAGHADEPTGLEYRGG